ncbi:unnamed protein product [Phaedon cochleariae]|uniref:Gustatory receptor n=1 Tax=Phaedon cochleariae TaxID=80249 RepID=A0A9P0DR19_PHACE|nr:unnamed protein product [Phaedon cochleariae]
MDVKQDVRIVNYFFKFGKLLGVTPLNRENHFTLCVIYKLYVLILLISTIFGSLFSIISRYTGFWTQSTISQVILESVEIISEMLFMICTFLGALRYGNIWKDIFSTLEKVDNELRMEKLVLFETDKYWYIVKIVLFHFAYFCLHAYELLMWTGKSSRVNEYGYILYRIIMYYQFFMTLFAVKIIEVLQSRFQDLEKILKEVSSRSNIIISKTDNNILKRLWKLRKLYGSLYNVHQNVNLVFRYSIFYGTLSNILIVLGDLNYIVQFAHTSDEEFNIGVSFINTLYSVFYSTASVSIVMSCDRLEKIGQNMVTTCYLYRNIFEKTTVTNEFVSLAEYTNNMIPTFSAAGFFQVNQQLMSTLISAIITYFIIIIQFNLRF